MKQLLITAPIAGWTTPLSEVPDPVFSTGMMGDGVAIDPTGNIVQSPCAGLVTRISSTAHAVTLTADNGAELLIHIGIDTVALQGQGFVALAKEGQRVATGDALLRIDLDYLARHVRDLLSPVILTNPERFDILQRWSGRAVREGDTLMAIVAKAVADSPREDEPSSLAASDERAVVVGFEHGIHARPAARVAACAREYQSAITLQVRGQSANGRSAVSIMGLAIRQGETVLLRAAGDDAKPALEALAALIGSDVATVETTAVSTPTTRRDFSEGACLTGVRMSPGLAVGRAFRMQAGEGRVPEYGHGIEVESAALNLAKARVAMDLSNAQPASPVHREILDAQREFLADPELQSLAQAEISLGKSAGYAWRRAIAHYRTVLQNCGDAHIAQRADDLLDVERQVLDALAGVDGPEMSIPHDSIIVAENLVPSQILQLSGDSVVGICTARGGATSHVAILAAEMGIPAIAGMGDALLAVDDGTPLIVDADQARLLLNPKNDVLAQVSDTLRVRRDQAERARRDAHHVCRLRNGEVVEVFANVGGNDKLRAVRDFGADGCGLLRTEFLFEHRNTAPSQEEQEAVYQNIVSGFDGRPVVIRTLDAGGDKAVPYLRHGNLENPAFGPRGIRMRATHPELLEAQLRAIARVSPRAACRVLLPMVSAVEEVIEIRKLLETIDDASPEAPLSLGVMIETPAAALIVDHLVQHVDFMAIGSNDLTQYVLAMDRGDSSMAAALDSLHPAVLRLIAGVCQSGARAGKPISVCGAMAADPVAIPILIGLGVRRLSVASATIPFVKQQVRALQPSGCEQLATCVLALPTTADVRAVAQAFLANCPVDEVFA